MSRTVILDTDPGIDDAMALFYLAKHPAVHLHSVTTVFGNASVEVTARNASYLVDRFGLGIPVFAGAGTPLNGPRYIPELKVHGADGFGDTGVAANFHAVVEAKPAWQHLADTVEAHPGKITLVAVAPLTNLALALRHRPGIADLVERVIVMGGAFGTNGRSGNIRPNAEANFFYDPAAADEVLAAKWPVTVVGLDVTTACILSSRQSADLAARAGEAGEFLYDISRDYTRIYRDFDGIDGFCIHDVAAAVAVTDPELFDTAAQPLAVATAAGSEGHSVFVPAGDAGRSVRPVQRVCVKVDDRALVETFMTVMTNAALFGTRAAVPDDRAAVAWAGTPRPPAG